KSESPIADVTIRLIASSRSEGEAQEILSDMESAFNQFDNPHGNSIRFERLHGGRLDEFLRNFSFRLSQERGVLPVSLRELTSMFHLPSTVIRATPELKVAKAGTAAAPIGLPASGLLLGLNRDGGRETGIYMMPEDRLRHFYCIGQTGTGKTTLLKNMVAQDIQNGEGVCFIDPHGSDVQDLLALVPPNRYEDVVYFDPGAVARPMGLNMLEFDQRYPEQKTFVVNEMLSIFNKLFDMKTVGGPMFEQYFRHAALLVLEDPESGTTLVDLSRTLSDKAFRAAKLAKCKNPIIVQFWREVAEKAGGEAALQNIVPYITSKFDGFLSNDIMRPIIAQEKSTFNFREIMDSRKILLVNLSKGRLGDINSHLLGLIIVGKILMAALSRVDALSQNPAPFYLYIDEFQNVTTDSISVILSEARKYRLSLNIAHQFIKQLDERIKDAVFGNVGSMASFRVGAEDGEFLEKQFAPVFSARDIINLDNRHAYLKFLVNGRPVKPFNIETLPPPAGNPAQTDKLKELSYLKFGRPREEIEAEVLKRYAKPTVPALVAPPPPPASAAN
ncbi:MAG TPA: ATP-binding protein, partial [Candidatus Paceibacterota bacterium]